MARKVTAFNRATSFLAMFSFDFFLIVEREGGFLTTGDPGDNSFTNITVFTAADPVFTTLNTNDLEKLCVALSDTLANQKQSPSSWKVFEGWNIADTTPLELP